MRRLRRQIWLLAVLLLGWAPGAPADIVTDANQRSADIASRHPATPVSVRMMAIVQVSVFESVNAISGRYPAFRVRMNPAAPLAHRDAREGAGFYLATSSREKPAMRL